MNTPCSITAVLMRMTRGSGLSGLAAMAPVSPLPAGEGRGIALVRPLLGVPKARLIATLERAKIEFADDPSNRDPRFTRPRLRDLMPILAREGLDAHRLALLVRRIRRAETTIEMAVAAAAKVLSEANDHAAAIVRGRKAVELASRSDYAYYTLGLVYRRAERWPDAADAFTRAVELNASNARARAGLASAALRLGRIDVATAQFAAMIDLRYQVAPAQFNLGLIAQKRGDSKEAGRRFRLALEADPAFKPARDALAKLK